MCDTPEKKWFIMENDERTEIFHCEEMPSMNSGPWSKGSCAYSSREELIEKNGILDEPCRICGRMVSTHYVPETKKKLTEKNICFNCNYWDERAELHKKPHSLVIDGVAYTAHKTQPGDPANFRGFSGRLFRFRRFGSEEVEECTNMWYQGPVPVHFRDRLQDNAEFVKDSQHQALT